MDHRGQSRDETVGDVAVLSEDGRQFVESLRDWLAHIGFTLPSGRPLSILDVGCGDCSEAKALLEAFGKSGGLRLVGIDLDEVGLRRAEARLPEDIVEFIAGDAARVSQLIGGRFDLAIVRHPDLPMRWAIWRQIYAETALKLTESGVMVVTFYSEGEWRASEHLIQDLGLRLIAGGENPITSPTARDRWFVIAAPKLPPIPPQL